MSDFDSVIARHKQKLSDAVQALGAPEKGHVWLYRVEHLRDLTPGERGTSVYVDAEGIVQTETTGVSDRWFCDDFKAIFERMFRYVRDENHDGVENIRLSAVQVPLSVAAACYLGRTDAPAPQTAREDMTALQRARSSTSDGNATQEYFFPKKLDAAELGGNKEAADRARKANRILAGLEARKQPLYEIPLSDYLGSPEAWRDQVGKTADAAHKTSETRSAVLFYDPASEQKRTKG